MEENCQAIARLTKGQLVSLMTETITDLTEDQIKVLNSRISSYLTKETATADSGKKKKQEDHNFDMSKYRQRHIALHLQYDGAKYLGFASSEDGETVESHLFNALMKLRLIESRQTCGYSRCGRTDKGVSALGQVIALRLRSAIPINSLECEYHNQMTPDDSSPLLLLHPEDRILCRVKKTANKMKSDQESTEEAGEDGVQEGYESKEIGELDYCQMINRCLPNEIRVLGWTEVTPQFSARFSAISRTYRYFFLRKSLDLSLMNEAATLLIGDHDFRNLCKMDMAHVSNFRREIYEAKISIIQGVAFLWHMVRCIMAILFLVGEKKEAPDIVTRLLDIEENPSKPEYAMAPDLPLVLHESGFEQLSFKYQPAVLWTLTAHYRALWEEHILAAIRVKNTLNYLSNLSIRQRDLETFETLIQERTKRTPNDELIRNRKRPRDDPGDKAEIVAGSIVWKDAVDDIQRKYSLCPANSVVKGQKSALCLEGEHVPLLQRKKADDYETKKANLKGAKKDRLLRHEESKKAGISSSTGEFFQRMRTQGSG